MAGSHSTTKHVVVEIALLVASQVRLSITDPTLAEHSIRKAALYYTLRWAIGSFTGTGDKKNVNAKQMEALKRLGHTELKLNEYESVVANEVIHPDDIPVKFSDIGGLDPIIASLRESVIYPLLYPTLFTSNSSLLGAPKGVLLYGPPGCGKTMLAKALAKESGATFINIAASVLTNKWKVQPSIIFIDEIDSFLRERSSGDHEVTAMMKAEFMTLWDGLLSSTDRILVLGATNRPNDIDSAIFRRLPKRFAVTLPDLHQRMKILKLMLQDVSLSLELSIEILARASEGLSGSDLKELCRAAAMVPVREYMRENLSNGEVLTEDQLKNFKPRPVTLQDFLSFENSGLLSKPVSPLPEDRSRIDSEDGVDAREASIPLD
ncbi:P-loop containing nucleoside triphosphate hydrolase protein [Lentinula guzmanii]|uniref:P-loop containing nucleoside triphosphate hydrolase protein n=1 Tax=Lentinula guzmanii TaxID=2804957 RepID=A0AA38JH66_9AGAR|nr:P-loop containing nucleoside triphosphate hydrolase protein [Lentinula guzmanii]